MATFRGHQFSSAQNHEIIDIPEEAILPDSKNSGFEQNANASLEGTLSSPKDLFGPSVSHLVWEAGKEQAKKAYILYANIDILRTYFNVEPEQVRQRIIDSLIPKLPNYYANTVLPGELYGPLMLVFTQIALLLYGMKSSGHIVREGTLMGTAFGICFSYWIGAAAFVYFIAYLCNSRVTFLQVLSMMGYALSGHCITLFLSTAFHPQHTHIFFYLVWLIFGGLTSTKLVFALMARTDGKSQRLLVCTAIALLHMLDLLYLHFAYHATVEVFDKI